MSFFYVKNNPSVLYCKFFVSLFNCFNIKLTIESTELCYIFHGFTKFYILLVRQVEQYVHENDKKDYEY